MDRALRTGSVRHQQGVSYLALLAILAVLGIFLGRAGEVWSTKARREKEAELLFVGDQIRQAIAQYYFSTPAAEKRYPPTLSALLHDNRFPAVRRHLRRIYRDPLTDRADWGLIPAPGGGVMGVYSLASGTPFRRAGFPAPYQHFEGAASYRDWRFEFVPPATTGTSASLSR